MNQVHGEVRDLDQETAKMTDNKTNLLGLHMMKLSNTDY